MNEWKCLCWRERWVKRGEPTMWAVIFSATLWILQNSPVTIATWTQQNCRVILAQTHISHIAAVLCTCQSDCVRMLNWKLWLVLTFLITSSKHICFAACLHLLSNIPPSLPLSPLPCGAQPLPNLASPVLTVSMETYSVVAGLQRKENSWHCVCVCVCVHSHYLGWSALSAWLRLTQTEIHPPSHIYLLK